MSLFIHRGRANRRGDYKEIAQLERKIVELANTSSDVLKEFMAAMDFYETALSSKNGRVTRAIRTWMMIDRRGILGAVEQLVTRKSAAMGFAALGSAATDRSFEAIVAKHPEHFSPAAIRISKDRLAIGAVSNP